MENHLKCKCFMSIKGIAEIEFVSVIQPTVSAIKQKQKSIQIKSGSINHWHFQTTFYYLL